MSLRAGSELHAASAPALAVARNFRKSRRSIRLLIVSLVTGGTVHRCPPLVVTVQAPAHLQRSKLVDLVHRLHRPVALLAAHAGAHVALMREVNEVRHAVDSNPGNGLALLPVGRQLAHLRLPYAHQGVTAHAGLNRRNPRHRAAPGVGVTILAGNLFLPGVQLVAEEYGLLDSSASEQPMTQAQSGERDRKSVV